MAHKQLDIKIKRLVQRYGLLAKSKWNIDQVIVFGSQAKGNSHKWSDIDVCLVSPQFEQDFFAEKSQLRRLTTGISSKIEPTPMHPATLQSKYNTLATEIRKYGIVVDIS